MSGSDVVIDVTDFKARMLETMEYATPRGEAKGEQASQEATATLQDEKQAFTLLGASDLTQSEPMAWKMKGLVPWRGVGQVYGASMSAKTFLLIDYCKHQARGEHWYGHRTTSCPVLYVCLEGVEGFKNRIRAYERWTRRDIPENMQFILEPFDISSKGDVAKLAPLCPKGALIVIDTQNASSPFVDENSAKDMGAVINGAKCLAAAVEGFVLLVAHSGKDVSRGVRGSSVQLPAWDFCMEVRRHDQDRRSWRVVKSKDGEDGQEHFFKLDKIYLGKDEDGDAITSCVASPDTLTKTASKPLTPVRQLALNTLGKALQDGEAESVYIDDWRPLFYSEHTGDTPDAKRMAFLNARTWLANNGYISVSSDYYSINSDTEQANKGEQTRTCSYGDTERSEQHPVGVFACSQNSSLSESMA